MATGHDILILYNYFLFAHEMRSRWVKSEPPAAQPISGGAIPEAAILSMLQDRVWLAALYAAVEGWNDLRLNRPATWDGLKHGEYLTHCQVQINTLLGSRTGEKVVIDNAEVDETFEILLRRARNKVFHFEPDYMPDAVRRLNMEAESRRWPQQLHDWLEQFFSAWFQSQPRG